MLYLLGEYRYRAIVASRRREEAGKFSICVCFFPCARPLLATFYVGSYFTNNVSRWHGETWARDPTGNLLFVLFQNLVLLTDECFTDV